MRAPISPDTSGAASIVAIRKAAMMNEEGIGTNPLGAKGCGDAGCAGALPSVMNALVDALSEFGIRHINMPAASERVRRAIHNAPAGASG
jgi:CO/xanthine dehydrogenase Mo-binding subunit